MKFISLDVRKIFTISFTGAVCCVQSLVYNSLRPHGLPDSSVPGISQAGILKWVAISFSGDLPYPETELASLVSPALAGRFFTTMEDH